MIKGCQKKIIYLKNTDSCMFDEAYFILGAESTHSCVSERDMVAEAKRIIEGAALGREEKSMKKKNVFAFVMGVMAATAFFLVLGMILLFL